MPLIEPLHKAGCACRICVAERKIMVRSTNPLMQKKATEAHKSLIPRSEAIAMAKDELDFHLSRIEELKAELERLGDIE